jgi:hypothetical protein
MHLCSGREVGSDTNEKPPVATSQFEAEWHFVCYHLQARFVEVWNALQGLHLASLPPYVRSSGAERLRRRAIETRDLAIAMDHDDRNIDRIKDADYIGALSVPTFCFRMRSAGPDDPELNLVRSSH